MNIEIRHISTEKILWQGKYDNVKSALEDAVRAGANLADANLNGANLIGANLVGANFAHAYLADANLIGANLNGANLNGANFAHAYLAHANLADANLNGANLIGANLIGANLNGELLKIQPLQLLGLKWEVLITPAYIKIGFERHTHEEWASFGRVQIGQIGRGAWDWWRKHKDIILNLAAIHRAESEVK